MCSSDLMGIETGSPHILRVINKGETHETISKAIELLKNYNIRVKGFFIVGLPSESPESIKQMEDFILSNNLDDIDFTIFQPYKKSHIYENKHLYDIQWDNIDLQKSWYKGLPESYNSQVWTSKMSQRDIVEARIYLEQKYKKWIQ